MFRAAFTSALQAKLQATQRKTAWLSRFPRATCPHELQHWDVYAGGTFSTLPGALSSRRRTSIPHPDLWISRLRPAFWATFRPGALAVPFAEAVMALISRSS